MPGDDRPTPRDRLLEAADALFYAEGVRSVGIDRVIAEAGVAKASLYNAFGSKEALITSYLTGRSENWQGYVAEALPVRFATAHERLLGIFTLLGEWFTAPGYHGCPFINASAEAVADGTIEQATSTHRAWVRRLFEGLARETGARDPEGLSRQLVLLYDGAMVGAQLDHDPDAARTARTAAAALLAPSDSPAPQPA